jgi:gamma-glutamyltranspeptidase/glutathione hydrolase
MCPTIVLKDHRPVLILGSPGSERIPSAVLQTISNLIDHGMDLPDAVAAPRMHWQNGVLHLEGGIAPGVAEQLRRKGHTVKTYSDKDRYFGGVHAILIDPQTGLQTAMTYTPFPCHPAQEVDWPWRFRFLTVTSVC